MNAAQDPVVLDLPVSDGESGVLRAHHYGAEDAPMVVCVHGLSANARGFRPLALALAEAGHRVVAFDLRGRGHSPAGPPGSHGLRNHMEDLLECATDLGATRFSFVGHSMGAFIGMLLAKLAGERLERLVLIDGAGPPEEAALAPIVAGLARLGERHASAESYLERVRQIGVVDPWNEDWEAAYRYELIEVDAAEGGGVRSRTSRDAVLEDSTYVAACDLRSFWPSLRMPTLLVRATRPLGAGFIVSVADRDRFLREAPGARAIEVDANHYGVLMHPETIEATRDFLR